jgi:excisionase family DNA binding protein
VTIVTRYHRLWIKGDIDCLMTADEILGVKDVAQILKVSTRTVIRLAERGELTAFKVGDLWRFRRSDVDDYIERQIQRRQKDSD